MGRPKGSKNKPREVVPETSTTVEEQPQVLARETKTPLERKLDHFSYETSEDAAQLWEHGKDINPLKLPDGLKKEYPNLRFRWCAYDMWRKRGKNYQGWQEFKDSKHPDGLKRGNDLFLCAIPEDLARKREKYFQDQSTEAVKDAQRRAIANIERIETEKDAYGGQPFGKPGEVAAGIAIGARPLGGNRGFQKEAIEEIIIKNRERMAKNRTYFIPK